MLGLGDLKNDISVEKSTTTCYYHHTFSINTYYRVEIKRRHRRRDLKILGFSNVIANFVKHNMYLRNIF